jgi:hypothetical protein
MTDPVWDEIRAAQARETAQEWRDEEARRADDEWWEARCDQ